MIEKTSTARLAAETEIIPLPSGATLLARKSEANDIVSFELAVPMGSRTEEAQRAGISTLALRMHTRGTRTKSDYEVAVGFESIGASFSTDVQKDRSFISLQTTRQRSDEALNLFDEILKESTFSGKHFETERQILKKEILEDLDSPYYAAVRLFQETLFEGHPYAHASSGSIESVQQLTRDEAQTRFRAGLDPSQISVGAVGAIDPHQTAERLDQLLGSLETNNAGSGQEPEQEGDSKGRRERRLERSTEAECMVYGFPTPGFRCQEYATLKILDCIMGGSMDSRLFAEVREKQGLVYQIGSIFPGLEWRSFFAIVLVSTVQNHEKVLETLGREIDKLKNSLPTADEVDRARTYLKGAFLMAQERNSDQALLLARYHSLGLGVDFIDQYPRLLDQVTPEDVQRVSQKLFHGPTIAIVGPGEKKTT